MRSATDVMRTYLYDVAIGGQLSLIDEIAAPDMVDEANVIFGGPTGRQGLVAHVRGFQKNVQNCQVEVQRIVGDELGALAWWTFNGVHCGPWLGKIETNDPVKGTVFSQFEVEDGCIQRYRLCLFAEFSDCNAIFDTSTGVGPKFL